MPGFGAFAIMTNVRFKREKRKEVWFEDSIRDWSVELTPAAAFPPFDVEMNRARSGSG
jgi:hypothetical protein